MTVLLCEEQSFLLHRQAGVDLAQNRQILTAVAQDTALQWYAGRPLHNTGHCES